MKKIIITILILIILGLSFWIISNKQCCSITINHEINFNDIPKEIKITGIPSSITGIPSSIDINTTSIKNLLNPQ